MKSSARSIPDNNLAYPVKVVLGNGASGSAVFVKTESGIFLATAKHVFFDRDTKKRHSDTATLTSFSRDLSAINRLSLDFAALESNGSVAAHHTHDVAVVKIGLHTTDQRWKPVAGARIVSDAADLVYISGKESTKEYADVLIANDVFLFGYPSSIGMKHLPQLDYDRPLLRKGIIAGKNDSSKTLILDCPVYHGNSGGPVIEVAPPYLRLVGVVSEFVPVAETWLNTMHKYTNTTITNSGYSIAEPVDFIFELLEHIG